MRSIWALLVLLSGQVAGESAKMSRSLSAAPAPIKAGDMSQLVKTLGELVVGIDKEQAKATQLSVDRKAACDKEERDLKAALVKSGHSVDDAREDHKLAVAQADEVEGNIKKLRLKQQSVSEEIDAITRRLKSERIQAGELTNSATQSTLQLDAVINQVQKREQQAQRKQAAGKSSSLRKKVSKHYKLQTEHADSDSDSDESVSSWMSFLQMEKRKVAHKARSVSTNTRSLGVLEADQQQLAKAANGVQEDFDKKEAEMIELLKAKHKEIVEIENSLGDAETSFSDKRRRVAEAERKLTSSANTIKRDGSLLDALTRKCGLVRTSQLKLGELRRQLSNLYEMPMKILKAIDTTSFLAKDLQTIDANAPSFVQIGSSSGTAAHSKEARSLSQVMRAAVQGEAMDGISAGSTASQDMRRAVSTASHDMHAAAASSSSASGSTEGPFDKVSQMIQGLIDSMGDQATKETTRHQWCADSSASNKNERLRTKSEILTAASSINEANILTEELKLQKAFDESEIARIEESVKTAKAEFGFEGKRLQGEAGDHEQSKEIVTRILVILNELCDLSSSNDNDKPGQCVDAAKLLAEGVGKIDALDAASNTYLRAFAELTQNFMNAADGAHRGLTASVQGATGTLANLASAISSKTSDKKKKNGELTLIETAETELQKGCGKHQLDTRETRMEHRDEEIKALKNALNVLEGEEVPVSD